MKVNIRNNNISHRVDFIDALKGISLIFIGVFHYVHDLAYAGQRAVVGSISTNLSRLFIFPMIAKTSLIANLFAVISSIGWQYVGIFLALSGFTLTYSRITKGDKGNFLKRRFSPFIPYFHFAIIFAFVINFFSRKFFFLEPYIYQKMSLDFSHYLYLLFFPGVIDFTFQHITVVNSSFWFIVLIFQFYFVFDILFYFLERLGWKKFLFWSIFLTLFLRFIFIYYFNNQPVAVAVNGTRAMTFFTLFPARLSEFALGMIMGYLFAYKKITIEKAKNIYHFIFFIIVWLLGLYSTFSIVGWIFSDTLLTFGLVYISAYLITYFDKSYLYKRLIFIGKYSLFVYLFHDQPITQLFMPLTSVLNLYLGHLNLIYVFFVILTILWVYGLAFIGDFFTKKSS